MVKCQNEDVFVIALALVANMPSQELIFFTGKKHMMRYIYIGVASELLSPHFCSGLGGLHAMRTCDSVSSFH